MKSGLDNLFRILHDIEVKLEEFTIWRYAPGFADDYYEIDKDPPGFLERHLENELNEISQLLNLDKKESLVLASILIFYMEDNYPVSNYFLCCQSLSHVIRLERLEFLKYQNEFQNLQDKNIIDISFYNYELAMDIEQADQSIFHDYGIRDQISPVGFFNKTFELTEEFVEKLKKL